MDKIEGFNPLDLPTKNLPDELKSCFHALQTQMIAKIEGVEKNQNEVLTRIDRLETKMDLILNCLQQSSSVSNVAHVVEPQDNTPSLVLTTNVESPFTLKDPLESTSELILEWYSGLHDQLSLQAMETSHKDWRKGDRSIGQQVYRRRTVVTYVNNIVQETGKDQTTIVNALDQARIRNSWSIQELARKIAAKKPPMIVLDNIERTFLFKKRQQDEC